jgi:probable rRNA maturation factor
VPTILRLRVRGGSKPLAARLRKAADRMLGYLDLSSAELSVLLVSDPAIRVMNQRHRGQDRPTDVLSFPLGETPGAGAPRLLGDVVISLPTAARQAKSRRRPLFDEARFLLAHGLLHLLGYDHDTKPRKQRMDAAARRLVRAAKTPR